ncbi:hypothetical protein CDL12_21889 [Handroanthus impetiginosus]|uniref:Uncharacterized protein n=1 Tax=Handroanthus impetiginosus TaxID=429701 RepID=A0A2G9GKL2_9LAMI|nr:hypothetical protein CDL12_21889 [Handroanthus impetiginosus]
MENSLRESLNKTQMVKEKFLKDPIIPFDCTNQFQNSMQFPVATTSDHDCQTQSWLPGGDTQHMMLPSEPLFLASRDMDCTRDVSFAACSSYFGDVKEQDLVNSRQSKNEVQDSITIEDYTCSAPLRLPLVEQYPYHSFGNLSFTDLLEPGRDVNFQPSAMDYQINGNFELPRSVYNNFQHSLVPTVGSYAISMLNENSYPQPPN